MHIKSFCRVLHIRSGAAVGLCSAVACGLLPLCVRWCSARLGTGCLSADPGRPRRSEPVIKASRPARLASEQTEKNGNLISAERVVPCLLSDG